VHFGSLMIALLLCGCMTKKARITHCNDAICQNIPFAIPPISFIIGIHDPD